MTNRILMLCFAVWYCMRGGRRHAARVIVCRHSNVLRKASLHDRIHNLCRSCTSKCR